MAVFIGTSGWHYRPWVGPFYPAGMRPDSFLDFYRKRFRTVEINNSFYRLPTEDTLTSWRNSVPASFRFAIKVSRFITHNKKLKDSADPFRLFLERARHLETRLGPLLFQLPPNWKYNGGRLEEFLASLPQGLRCVFEFRHPDWMRDEAFALLERYHAGFCIHDMPGARSPEIATGGIAYVRFHGTEGKYRGSYTQTELEDWAVKLLAWNRKRMQVYVYFNNDIGGHAPKNAQTLMEMVRRAQSPLSDIHTAQRIGTKAVLKR